MPPLLKRLLRWAIGIVCIALLAVGLLLGVLRVLLPLTPRFQEDIAAWTSESLGYPVEFARIEPSWGLTGPEFRLRGVRVMSERGGGPLLLADEILVGLNLWTLLPGRSLNLDRMSIVGARLTLQRQGSETFSIQGRDPAYYPGGPARLLAFAPPEVRLQDIWIEYSEPARGVQENFWLEHLSMKIAGGRIVLDSRVVLPEEYGEWLGIGADIELDQWTQALLPSGAWRLHVEGRSVDLGKMRELAAEIAALPLFGSGDFSVFVDLEDLRIEQLFGECDFSDLWFADGPDNHVFDRLGGQFEWEGRGREYVLTAARLEAARDGRRWPDTELDARWNLGEQGELAELHLTAGFVRLEDAIPPLLGLAQRAGVSLGVVPRGGDVEGLTMNWEATGAEIPEIQAEFSGLLLTWPARELELNGVDGHFVHKAGAGNANLALADEGSFDAPWLNEPVELSSLQAELTWRSGTDSWSFEGNNLRLGAEGMEWAGRLSLARDSGNGSPVLEFSGGGERIPDLPAWLGRLPWKDTPGLPFGWLSGALHSGTATRWNMQLSGPLRSFPFSGAVLRVEMDIENADLTVHDAWPDLENLSGSLVLNGSTLVILDAEGDLAGVRWRDAKVEVTDLLNAVVEISGNSDDDLPRLLAGLARTPFADRIHPTVFDAETGGPASTHLEFRLPIADRSTWEVATDTTLEGARFQLNNLTPPVENLRGTVSYTRAGVRGRELQGQFLGEPLILGVAKAPPDTAGYGYQVQLHGSLTAGIMQELFGWGALDRLSGQFAWQGEVLVPSADDGPAPTIRVRMETDLIGLESALPYPMAKPADTPGPTQLELSWGSDGPPRLAGRLGLGPGVAIEFDGDGTGWRIDRAHLHFGDSPPRLPQEATLLVDGSVDRLRPSDWVEVLVSESNSLGLPWTLDLKAGEVYSLGSALKEQSIRVRPRDDGWMIRLQGEAADGRVFWPRAGVEGAQLLADLNWLRLTHPDPQPGAPANPRALPGGKLLLDELEIGEMRLGSVRARYEKTAGGLAVNWFRTRSPAFSSEGSAAWLVTDEQGEEQLGRLDMALDSTDVGSALEQLGYARAISGDRGMMNLSANWEGPPTGDFLARANGSVSVEVQQGEVVALDPGGGRMLGMLSLARLPRKLALDFREVTEEGLPFDRLAGDFSLRDGQAYTCNMGLQGAVAGLALFGRTGLQDRSYDQVAVVSPNLPDLLSLGGVIVGGTGLGATMLLLSQVFRDPLQAISANYYEVSGSWDEPMVTRVLREEIDLGAFEDCALYLEEHLSDMPEIDWDALLSKAEEAALEDQHDEPGGEALPADAEPDPVDEAPPPATQEPSEPAPSVP